MAELKLRFVRQGNAIYVRTEDVAALLREFGATEETDVRKRCEELAADMASYALYGES